MLLLLVSLLLQLFESYYELRLHLLQEQATDPHSFLENSSYDGETPTSNLSVGISYSMTSLGVDNLTTTGCFRDVGAPVPTITRMCHKLDIDQQDIPTIWAVLVDAEEKG
jgi:hypothetical protein